MAFRFSVRSIFFSQFWYTTENTKNSFAADLILGWWIDLGWGGFLWQEVRYCLINVHSLIPLFMGYVFCA